MVCGLYDIIMVAPSSPIDLIHAISMPTSIPVLAKGIVILKKTSDFFFPRTLAAVSYLSGTPSNAAWGGSIITGDATYICDKIIPTTDCVKSIGIALPSKEYGPKAISNIVPLLMAVELMV